MSKLFELSAGSNYLDIFRFLIAQRVTGFTPPREPCFDPQCMEYFVDRLNSSNQYLEFGSGGSTYYAARLKKDFVSVDSDQFFLRAVKAQIEQDGLGNSTLQTFHHADIGMTRDWGQPIFTKREPARLARWARYSDMALVGRPFLPDLILIDGRFRVACALKSVKYLYNKVDYTVLIDDYVERSHYSEVERFANLVQLKGRMGVFKQKDGVDFVDLERAIASSELDYR